MLAQPVVNSRPGRSNAEGIIYIHWQHLPSNYSKVRSQLTKVFDKIHLCYAINKIAGSDCTTMAKLNPRRKILIVDDESESAILRAVRRRVGERVGKPQSLSLNQNILLGKNSRLQPFIPLNTICRTQYCWMSGSANIEMTNSEVSGY